MFISIGQDKPALRDNLFIEGRSHYGFIWPHRSSVRYLQVGHVPAFELKVGKSTFEWKEWGVNHNFPDIGLAFYHADLQWPEVLGDVNAIYGFMNKTLYRGELLSLSFDFELGVAVLNRFFNPETNYYNVAIGSSINAFFDIGMEVNWKLSNNIKLINGISITHYSNGGTIKPNLGLNVITTNMGIRYTLNPKNINLIYEKLKTVKKYDSQIFVAGGWKEIYPNIVYATSSFNIDAGYYLTATKRFALGLDIFYDGSIVGRMEKKGVNSQSDFNNLRQGIHFSYEMIYGSVSFSVQMGSYVFVEWLNEGRFYNRLLMKYQYNNYIFSLGMKTHFGRADFLEWGIGYVLWNE